MVVFGACNCISTECCKTPVLVHTLRRRAAANRWPGKLQLPACFCLGVSPTKALQLAAQSPKLAVQVISCQLSFVSTPTTLSKTCNLPSRSNSALKETGLCSTVGDKYVEQSLYDQVGGKIFAQNAQTSKISGSGWKRWALPCTPMKLKKDFDAAWVVT